MFCIKKNKMKNKNTQTKRTVKLKNTNLNNIFLRISELYKKNLIIISDSIRKQFMIVSIVKTIMLCYK